MLKIECNVENLDKLDKLIDYINKLIGMKKDTKFQEFIQNKVLELAKKVSRERLGGTTNDEYIEEYILRHQIRQETDGFVLYNNFTIPAILSTKSNARSNYDTGFSIALAFEYGVGIVGEENPVQGAWAYNVNEYEKGWYYKTQSGEVLFTRGYKGMEIYRHIADECNKNIMDWVNEYYREEVI